MRSRLWAVGRLLVSTVVTATCSGYAACLLTSAAYGVDQFLCVYGDKPSSGGRTSELTVRSMIEEIRTFRPAQPDLSRSFRVGVAAGLGGFPSWKATADFVFVQVCFSMEDLLRWRDAAKFDQPVYAGVMVIASVAMARRLAAEIPDISIPSDLVERIGRDSTAGVEVACARPQPSVKRERSKVSTSSR